MSYHLVEINCHLSNRLFKTSSIEYATGDLYTRKPNVNQACVALILPFKNQSRRALQFFD